MLNLLGNKLGYEVEPRGMSNYAFIQKGSVFYVWAHNDLSANSLRADEPLKLSCKRSSGLPELTSQIAIAKGMTLSEVEECFRDFIQQIAPAK
jgi:hypothetical protein